MASTVDDFAPPPPTSGGMSSRMDRIMNMIWNSEKGEFLGRDGWSWGKISLFYFIFYSCLAAFFALCLALFFLTVSEDDPKLKDSDTLLGENPGMGFRPMPNYQTTLIRFEQGRPSVYKPFTDQLQAFLEQYDPARVQGDELDDCQNNVKNNERTVCKFSVNAVIGSVCTRQNGFGYEKGKPCVLLKMNRIYGWKPDLYKSLNESSAMKEVLGSRFDPDYVGISCQGENPADKEYIGKLSYHPPQGIHKKFFPFLNQRGYRQPFTFVKFENPKEGQVIQVTCKLWAKNIANSERLIDSVHRQGSVHFELLVD